MMIFRSKKNQELESLKKQKLAELEAKFSGSTSTSDLIDKNEPKTFTEALRANLLTGIIVMLPFIFTIWLFKTIIEFFDASFRGVLTPLHYQDNEIFGLGLVFAVVLALSIGLLVRNYMSGAIMKKINKIFTEIPYIGPVYGATQQVLETISSDKKNSFKDVVLIEYPRKDCWVLGFLTGKTAGEVQKVTPEVMYCVFVPTTPNPTSGFLLFLPISEITILDMTVEQGLKMVISGGIVTPTEKETEKARQIKQNERNKKSVNKK